MKTPNIYVKVQRNKEIQAEPWGQPNSTVLTVVINTQTYTHFLYTDVIKKAVRWG